MQGTADTPLPVLRHRTRLSLAMRELDTHFGKGEGDGLHDLLKRPTCLASVFGLDRDASSRGTLTTQCAGWSRAPTISRRGKDIDDFMSRRDVLQTVRGLATLTGTVQPAFPFQNGRRMQKKPAKKAAGVQDAWKGEWRKRGEGQGGGAGKAGWSVHRIAQCRTTLRTVRAPEERRARSEKYRVEFETLMRPILQYPAGDTLAREEAAGRMRLWTAMLRKDEAMHRAHWGYWECHRRAVIVDAFYTTFELRFHAAVFHIALPSAARHGSVRFGLDADDDEEDEFHASPHRSARALGAPLHVGAPLLSYDVQLSSSASSAPWCIHPETRHSAASFSSSLDLASFADPLAVSQSTPQGQSRAPSLVIRSHLSQSRASRRSGNTQATTDDGTDFADNDDDFANLSLYQSCNAAMSMRDGLPQMDMSVLRQAGQVHAKPASPRGFGTGQRGSSRSPRRASPRSPRARQSPRAKRKAVGVDPSTID